MSYTLNRADRDDVPALSANERHDYFVEKILEGGKVWTLGSDRGMVMMSSDGEECLPVWPHPDFAAAWASDDWSDCEPVPVELDAWLERWLPGMQSDEVVLAIFPGSGEDTMVVDPGELEETLLQRMKVQ